MNIASEITPYLMLGSVGARTAGFLQNNNITLVINAAKGIAQTEECSVTQIRVNCDDEPDYFLKQHFDTVAAEINKERGNGGKIFVHCVAGISRAPSLVIAYLMRYENMTLQDAYELVREKRTFIRPNPGFWKQLVDDEKELKGTNSVTMINCGSKLIPSVYKLQYENMVSL